MAGALSRDAHPVDVAVPPLLDALSASLRAGGTLRDGFEAAAEGPLAPLVRSVLARADGGAGMRDALDACGRRHVSPEISLAFGAMSLALETGAAQASLLDVVAQRARDRVALAREIRAMSASARASAAVVAFAPVVFGALVVAIDRSVLVAALASTAGRACVGLGVVLEAAGAWWMRRLLRRPLRAVRDARDDLPECVDLIALAMAAGLGVSAAIAGAAPRAPGQPGRTLRIAAARLAAGGSPASVLASWPVALGDDVRPLVAALLAAHHDGAPAHDALDRLAADLRHARRQRAIEQVQRLPVLLLFPLVVCVLPAFVLLTVAPLAIGSIAELRA